MAERTGPRKRNGAERADLEAEGIQTIPALKGPGSVSRGIQAVEQRLIGSGNGPRLHFLRGSLVEQDDALRAEHKPCSTEEEFDVYVWARKADGSVNKEEPKKENDDGMDALRYGVVYEDKDCIDPAGDDKNLMIRTVQAARASLGEPTQRTPGLGGRGSRWL